VDILEVLGILLLVGFVLPDLIFNIAVYPLLVVVVGDVLVGSFTTFVAYLVIVSYKDPLALFKGVYNAA
jgi:hypothetical protein